MFCPKITPEQKISKFYLTNVNVFMISYYLPNFIENSVEKVVSLNRNDAK